MGNKKLIAFCEYNARVAETDVTWTPDHMVEYITSVEHVKLWYLGDMEDTSIIKKNQLFP